MSSPTLGLLFEMAAARTRVGLLYERSDTDTCQRIAAELTRRCPGVEITADVTVDDDHGKTDRRYSTTLILYIYGHCPDSIRSR